MDLKIIAFTVLEFKTLVIPSMASWAYCILSRKPSAFPTMYVVLPTAIGETLRVEHMTCHVRGTVVSFWNVNFCWSCIPSSLLNPWCAIHSLNSCHWSAISGAQVLVFSMIHSCLHIPEFSTKQFSHSLCVCKPCLPAPWHFEHGSRFGIYNKQIHTSLIVWGLISIY